MKVLLITESWDLSTGPTETLYCDYRRILTREGCRVEVVDNKRNYLPIGGQTMWTYPRALRFLGWSYWNNLLMNRRIIRAARRMKPDLVLLFKCENVFSSTIEHLREVTEAVIFNWDFDSPFWPTNTSMDLLRSIQLYDGFGSLAEHFIPTLETMGCPRVEYLPMFFNRGRFEFDDDLTQADHERFDCDLLFIGRGTPERARVLRSLVEWDLAIWGNWSGVRLSPDDPLKRCLRGAYLGGREYAKAMRCCKIALNFLVTQCRGANNLRTFEATGLGAFLLTEYSREQAESLFEEGRELVCFRSMSDLKKKIAYYLANAEERLTIARAGRARCLAEHTLSHRLRGILQVAAELRTGKSLREDEVVG